MIRLTDILCEGCWDGYKQVGMKELNGKMVPNCVPVEELYHRPESDVTSDDEINEGPNSPAYKGPVGYDDGCDCYPNDPDENVDELNEGEFCNECLIEVLKGQHQDMLGEAEYHGRKVPLGKPMRGDVKKFKVFVKDPSTGNIKKVNFGDKKMRIKKSIPARRKSFRARHRCSNPGPRTKARYWSCRKW